MKFLKTTIISAAFALAATSGSAAILTYNGFAGAGGASVSENPSGAPSYSGLAGSFKMGDAGNVLGLGTNFIAFCLDITGTIVSGKDYVINNVNPFQPGRELSALQRQNVEDLFDAAYGGVDVTDSTDAAAFQLALWEAAYETDAGPLSLASGTRIGSGIDIGGRTNGAAITARAQEFLDAIGTWGGSDNYFVNFLDASEDARQDLVTAAPIPVPAAGLLLVTGLGALGAMRRRAKKKAA